jgi:CRP/FNR family cyclic AMP-dependent transcriptional regulator
MKKVLFILSELSHQDIDWLLKNGDQQKVPKDTILIHQGQPIDALYIVLDGTLSVSIAGWTNQHIAEITCGEVLGEMSFVDGSPPSATVQALEDSLVLAIKQEILSEKLDNDLLFSLRFYQAITKFLSYRLRGTVKTFTNPQSMKDIGSYNPELVGENLEIAEAKFDRLLQGIN